MCPNPELRPRLLATSFPLARAQCRVHGPLRSPAGEKVDDPDEEVLNARRALRRELGPPRVWIGICCI